MENNRLKKMIAASEKKISAIGSKLISVAKDKLKEGEYVYEKEKALKSFKSQNSTIKLGA